MCLLTCSYTLVCARVSMAMQRELEAMAVVVVHVCVGGAGGGVVEG